MRVSLSRGVGTGQLSCRSSAPFPKQGAWELCSPHGREPAVEWPRVPVGRRTERAEQHPLKATWAPAWLFARASRMCHLSLRVGAGCLWTGLVNRKGSSRLGRQGALPCEPVPSCQHTGSITICRPGAARTLQALPGVGGQLWTVGTKSSCAGFSPRQTQASTLLSARSLLSPWALQAPALGGGLLLPQGGDAGSSLRGCRAWPWRDGPLALTETSAPGRRRVLAGSLGVIGPSQPPSRQLTSSQLT